MKNHYFKSIVMIERLHRLFLEVLRVELDRMKIGDINNIQCLILYNIGRGQVAVGELTNRGYYLGSNVSYNLSKMVHHGYLIQEQNVQDRRTSYIKLSAKGIKLHDKLDGLFTMQIKALAHEGIDADQLNELDGMFTTLEGFWKSLLVRNP